MLSCAVCMRAAAKDKVEEAAPGSASDAAASVKEAASSATDLVPDSAKGAATAAADASKTNPFGSLFGGKIALDGVE